MTTVIPAADSGLLLSQHKPMSESIAHWEGLDHLTQYLVETHHGYVRHACPLIVEWLDTLVSQHPELHKVRETFVALRDVLLSHLIKEEHLLFPYINELAVAARAQTRPPAGPFATILHPVRVMEAEHEAASALLEQLRSLTNDYTPPAGSDKTYRVCYEELTTFAEDFRRHIYLENNVLFPKALELETRWV
jgi:regulator of cell morphogenesis and NO signaling